MMPPPNPDPNPLRDRLRRIEGESHADWLARLRQDMHARAQDGTVPRVEEYLAAFPELAGDRETVLDLVAMERQLRAEAGEEASTPFYLDRFPDHREAIAEQLDFDRAIDGHAAEGIGPDDDEDEDSPVPAPAGSKDAPPRLPDPYLPIRRLGKGSFGEVWLCRDSKRKRPVAIKVLRGDGERVSARFRREAEITANIRHSNVGKLFDHELDHDPPFLVLEYIDGRTLFEILKSSPRLEIDEAIRIAREIADGCLAFHKKRIVHRDLKPANIKEDEHGHIKILDLGLARPFEPGIDRITSDGSLLGSIPYMSPEQVDGRVAVEAASDQFALGAILYEMLTGSPPFLVEPDQRGTATLLRIAECRPDDPRKSRPEVDEALASIVLRMLQAKPADRFASMAEVVKVLDAYRAGNREPVPLRPRRKWRRRAVVAAVVSAVTAGAFGLGMAIGPNPPSPPRPALSSLDVMTLIRDDLDRTGHTSDLPPWRYFTLTNLAGDPAVTPDVLRRHREALTELVAALGVRAAAPPEAIDQDELVLRVDARALGWSDEWTRRVLHGRNPYALQYPDDATAPALRNVARDVERRLGEVSDHYPAMTRVDWFLATFTRPEDARALLASTGAGPEEVEAKVGRLAALRRRWDDLLKLYDRPVDLASAAREVGLADEAAVRRAIFQLPGRVGGEDRLGLGPLTEGKTVPRSTWVFSDMPYSTFGQVCEQLKLGRRLLKR